MAEDISDDKFKAEVMRFIDIAGQKFDGLIADVRTNSFHLEKLETKVDGLETKVDGLEVKVDGLETAVGRMEKSLEEVTSNVRFQWAVQ